MKLNYQNADFLESCFNPDKLRLESRPEILFVGRSNVGKSSMINSILNRKSFARISQTPGKTIAINFFDIDKKIYLVDLPGYGFAKRSKSDREKWGDLIGKYLRINRDIRIIIMLVDIRHEPSENDIIMYRYLMQTNYLFTVIATKADKIKPSQVDEKIRNISKMFRVKAIPFSSETKQGVAEIKQIIEDVCDPKPEEDEPSQEVQQIDYTIIKEID